VIGVNHIFPCQKNFVTACISGSLKNSIFIKASIVFVPKTTTIEKKHGFPEVYISYIGHFQ